MPEGDTLKCERCGYVWIQRGQDKPKTCSKCNSRFWFKKMTPYWKKRQEIKKNK